MQFFLSFLYVIRLNLKNAHGRNFLCKHFLLNLYSFILFCIRFNKCLRPENFMRCFIVFVIVCTFFNIRDKKMNFLRPFNPTPLHIQPKIKDYIISCLLFQCLGNQYSNIFYLPYFSDYWTHSCIRRT